MGLAHPALSTLGKKKGKQKFKSAEEKRKAMELAAEWEKLQAAHKPAKAPRKVFKEWSYTLSTPPGRETVRHESRGDHTGVAAKSDAPVYTGDKMIGISIIHKSCLQPIFNDQAAKDAANMRR